LILLSTAEVMGGEYYTIKFNKDDYRKIEVNGYIRLIAENGFSQSVPGEPELPIETISLYLSQNVDVVSIKVIDSSIFKYYGNYTIYPGQLPAELGCEIDWTEPNPIVYSSDRPYPENSVDFSGISVYRGHRLANLKVYPFKYVPSEGKLYFYSKIVIELSTEIAQSSATQLKMDSETIKYLKNHVSNTEDVPNSFSSNLKTGLAFKTSTETDSVPCLIICTAWLHEPFLDYADWKTRKGCRTEVQYVEEIEYEYPSDGLGRLGAIRNCIRDYYQNKYTEYVILGGDYSTIPALKLPNCGFEPFNTDQYYSCLDGSWNQDGDENFGESQFYGDTLDFEPEVFVGRIPCHLDNIEEAEAAINKIIAYESNTNRVDFQTKALLTYSNIWEENDSWKFVIEGINNIIPENFNKTFLTEVDSQFVCNAMSDGPGIMINNSHAQGPHNFVTKITLDPFQSHSRVWFSNIDSMNTDGKYGIFFNFTCHDNNLEYDCVSRSYMLNPVGGGVGYLGSTGKEFGLVYNDYYREIFAQIFDSNETHLGKAVSYAKRKLSEKTWITDNVWRYAWLSHMLLGDPSMDIYTEEPEIITFENLPETLYTNSSEFSTWVINSNNDYVEGVKVCLMMDEINLYEIGYTDETGQIDFTGLSLYNEGIAYITASKHNHFVLCDTIIIKRPTGDGGGGGGCPMLYVIDKYNQYHFINNVLAASETDAQQFFSSQDIIPIYDVPLKSDKKLTLRFMEEESEISYIDNVSVSYITYPPWKKPVLTSKNVFRFLRPDPLIPYFAEDEDGNNILEKIVSDDGDIYKENNSGYCILKYSKPVGTEKYAFEEGGGIGPPPPPKNQEKYTIDGNGLNNANILRVSVLDPSNQWINAYTFYPRIKRPEIFVDVMDYFFDGILTVKLEWGKSITLDYLPFYFYEDPDYSVDKLTLNEIEHSEEGILSPNINQLGGDYAILEPGQYMDYKFGKIRKNEGNIALVAVTINGYYNSINEEDSLYDGFAFNQNYPNPSNPSTTFSFSLPGQFNVNLTVYNILGQKVIELIDGSYETGNHSVSWNGENALGVAVSSGIYFAKFKAGNYQRSRKLIILK